MFAFRCARTGLYFPADYVEQWGRKYGKGLGIRPVSEALINDYLTPVAHCRDQNRVMHPVGQCYSQVDLVQIPDEEFQINQAIPMEGDSLMERRAVVMRERQILHDPAMRNAFPDEYKDIYLRDEEHNARVKEIRTMFKSAYMA
jgi:hypothetical protein